MVKSSWLFALLFGVLYGTTVLAEVSLVAKADKRTISLGEPLTIELRVDGVRESTSGIDLEKLKQDFNVYSTTTATLSPRSKRNALTSEIMTLVVYPLHTGKLKVPAFNYRGKTSKPLTVSVLEVNKQVLFKTAVDLSHPVVRQALTLTLDIYDDGTLQWSVPHEIAAAGIHQQWLAESQREEMLDGHRYTVHHYAWVLLPLREGSMTVKIPMLDAFKFGARLRYPVAPVRVEATRIPAYLPVYVPVGKMMLEMEKMPAEIALNRPFNWIMKIQGAGISIEAINNFLTTINSNEAIRFYLPNISIEENQHPISAMQTIRVTVPFVPLKTGRMKLPDINLPYYSPDSKRLESVFLEGESTQVFNPVWYWLQKIVSGFVMLLLVMGLGFLMYKKHRLFMLRRKSLKTITLANNVEALQQALLNFDGSLPRPLTLQQWLHHMKLIYPVDKRLTVLVEKTEKILYGKIAGQDIHALVQESVTLLKKLPYRKSGLPAILKI